MTDQFAALGVNTEGGEFVYVEAEDTADVTAKAALLEKAVTVFHLPLGDDYLYEQLKVEKPDNYEQLKAEQAAQRSENRQPFPSGSEKAHPQNRSDRFFAHAPQSEDGALGW